MKQTLLLLSMIIVCVGCMKPEPTVRAVYHANPTFEKDVGYARAVKADNVLYISGSVGWGEMPEAIKIAYQRIGETLKAHGLGFEHVVMETVYTTDIESLKAAKQTRKVYYTGGYPAASWVQVDRLFKPELVIEVGLSRTLQPEVGNGTYRRPDRRGHQRGKRVGYVSRP